MASWAQVLALRLERQHVARRTTPDSLVDVVGDLVGVHAQVMSSAELQLAARIDGLRVSDVREALWEQRRLAKVWAYRQTLHLLTPDDLAEFVAAARSLERWHTAAWLRYFILTEAEVEAMIDAVGSVLSERPMTRRDLVRAVTRHLGKPGLEEAMLTGWERSSPRRPSAVGWSSARPTAGTWRSSIPAPGWAARSRRPTADRARPTRRSRA